MLTSRSSLTKTVGGRNRASGATRSNRFCPGKQQELADASVEGAKLYFPSNISVAASSNNNMQTPKEEVRLY